MFKKTYHATHPDMMWGADNDDLRDRYLVQELFVAGEVSLNYSHNERFIIGGAQPAAGQTAQWTPGARSCGPGSSGCAAPSTAPSTTEERQRPSAPSVPVWGAMAAAPRTDCSSTT